MTMAKYRHVPIGLEKAIAATASEAVGKGCAAAEASIVQLITKNILPLFDVMEAVQYLVTPGKLTNEESELYSHVILGRGGDTFLQANGMSAKINPTDWITRKDRDDGAKDWNIVQADMFAS